MIIFLRGKVATGKTMIAQALHEKLKIPVIKKDDVFDLLRNHDINHHQARGIAYDLMAMYIQQLDQFGIDAIIDINLPHTPDFINFISKMAVSNPKYFLCTCSNDQTWSLRVQRYLDDKKDHLLFDSLEQAFDLYKQCDIVPLKNELTIDSTLPIDQLTNEILEMIRR